MIPGVARRISDEQNLENQMEKQMGCMAGFLQIFDRQQIMAGKRLYSTKRLSAGGGSTSPSERSETSVASSFIKSPETSPEIRSESPAGPVPLPVFEFKDGLRSSWKLREAPRLSLDSRAVVDAKGKLRPKEIRTTAAAPEADEDQRRSPSVVARLMGLDALPGGAPAKGAELRRSSSESRIPRDLSRDLSVPAESFQFRSSNFSKTDFWSVDPKPDPPKRMISQRKAVFEDFYPEPKQTGSLYVEIEKRLRMRGIDEPAKDLETLKQILEAVQLKGLLHSKIPNLRADHHDPPIVLMKPNPRSSLSSRTMPSERDRIQNPRARSPTSSPARSPISPANRRALNSALNRKPTPPPQKNAAAHSTRTSPRKAGPDPMAVRSPRSRTALAVSTSVEDKATENWRGEYSNGRRLLERCDKLLHSIAAITAACEGEQQPSPVSVLDSASVLRDDATSPSVVSKRSIDFQDQSFSEDWIPAISGNGVEAEKEDDFIYVSEILLASNKHRDPSEIYAMLEKRRQTSGAAASKASRLHRKLVFDAVIEILNFSPAGPTGAHVRKVWAEVRRMSDGVLPAAADLNEVTRGAVRKDLALRDHGWGRPSAETSDAVLHIERQIFKDLVAETIRDLAGEFRPSRPRRKLAF